MVLQVIRILFVFSLIKEATGIATSQTASVQFTPGNVFAYNPKAVTITVNVFSRVFHVNLLQSSSIAPYIHSKSPSNPISCHFEGYVSSYARSDAAFSLCSPEDAYGVISLDDKVFMVMNACSDRITCKRAVEYNFTVYGDLNSIAVQPGHAPTQNFFLKRARRDVFAAPSSQSLGEPSNLKILGENSETLYIRLLIASDPQQFSNNNNIKSQTERRAIQIANVAALLMRPLNIILYVMEHRVLSNEDIYYVRNISVMLSQINKYRAKSVDPTRNDIDVVHVLTSTRFDPATGNSDDADLLGQAYVSGICSRYAVSFSVDMTNSIVQVGATMAHELGHLLGLSHDKPTCVCPFADLSDSSPAPKIVNSSQCIMVAAKSVSGSQPLAWSNCSIQMMSENRKRMPPYCLRQRPNLSRLNKFCGNGVVEEGEQCDCGSPDLVNVWADVAIDNKNQMPPCSLDCCDMSTCQLARKNATCATGLCCNLDTCQLLPKYTECRKAASDCDLPEYCSGSSEQCPRDLHKATGYPCGSEPEAPASGTPGLCFAGYCHSREAQCRQLWGPAAKDGKPSCYAENRKGTEDGNCGHNRITWDDGGELKTGKMITKCPTIEDTFCGTLKCTAVPTSTEKTPLFVQPLTSDTRNGCSWTLAAMLPDYGLVRNGTKCTPPGSTGFDGICLNNLCVSLNDSDTVIAATFVAEGLQAEFSRMSGNTYPYGTLASQCKCVESRCFCNSVGSRHCSPGYEPPWCESSGCGGSLESNSAGLCSRVDGGIGTGAVIAIAVLGTVFGLGVVAVVVILSVGRRRLAEMYYHSRLFVQVENMRDHLSSARPASGGTHAQAELRRSNNSSSSIRRSLRGPPGPAPITTVSNSNSNGQVELKRHTPAAMIRIDQTLTNGNGVHPAVNTNDVDVDIQRPTSAAVAFNRVEASPPQNHRVASAPTERTTSNGTPARPPPPKSASKVVARPTVPPPPPPKPPKIDVTSPTTSPDEDDLPRSVAEAIKRLGDNGGVKSGLKNGAGPHAPSRTPPQESATTQWFSNVLKKNRENRPASQSPVMQRQPMLQNGDHNGDAKIDEKNHENKSHLQRRSSLNGNVVQITRVYPQ